MGWMRLEMLIVELYRGEGATQMADGVSLSLDIIDFADLYDFQVFDG